MNKREIIKEYNSGVSINAIAIKHHTYANKIRRLLIANETPLRHDIRKKRRILY